MAIGNLVGKLFGGRKFNFSIGYQLQYDVSETNFVELIRKYRKDVSEVFFAMPYDISGRDPMCLNKNFSPEAAFDLFYQNLDDLSAMGIKGVLLFNAACYGGDVSSIRLLEHVRNSIKEVKKHIDLIAVTTMSLVIAKLVKKEFPEIKVRASINMYVSSVIQMDIMKNDYDGFYMNRMYNRDMAHIKEMRKWCDDNGKTLHLLANSGCLYDCPHYIFHNNLVAHIAEIKQIPSVAPEYPSPCAEFISKPENYHRILSNTCIRPEDLHHYAGLFDTVKLATRRTLNLETTIKAYISGEHKGDLLDILEPTYSFIKGVPILQNDLIPDDWFERTSKCGHKCLNCNYCKNVLEKIRREPPEVPEE